MKKWLKKNRFMLIGILLGVLLAGTVIGLSIAFPGSVLLLPWIWFEGLSLVNMVLVSSGVVIGTGMIGGAIGKGIDVFGAKIVKQVGSLLSNLWNNLFHRKEVPSTVPSTTSIKSLGVGGVKSSNGMNDSNQLKASSSRSSSLSTNSTSSSPRRGSLASHSVLASSNQASRSRASSQSEGSHHAQKSLKDILQALKDINNRKPGWQGEIAKLREEMLQLKQDVILQELKQQGKVILNELVEEIKKEKLSSSEIETLLEQTMMKKLRIMFHPDKSGNNELANAIANEIEGWWEELRQKLQKVDCVTESGFSVNEWFSKMKAERAEVKEAFKQYFENADKFIEEQKQFIEEQKSHNKKVKEFFEWSEQYGKKVDETVKLAKEVEEAEKKLDTNLEILKKEVAILEKAVMEEIANDQADDGYHSDQPKQSANESKQRRKSW